MDAIKDYKRKQDKLWLFFTLLPKVGIGIIDKGEHRGERYDNKPYKFSDQYRKDFEAVINQAEECFLTCAIDYVSVEDDIAINSEKIDVIRKMVADYMKWAQYKPQDSKWLKSLLSASIISEEEFYGACKAIGYCSNMMRDNVQVMKSLLGKYEPELNTNKTDKVSTDTATSHGDVAGDTIYKTRTERTNIPYKALTDFLLQDGVLARYGSDSDTKARFADMVRHGNFGEIYKDRYHRKVEYLIHTLSPFMESSWFSAACKSIGKSTDEVNKHKDINVKCFKDALSEIFRVKST